MGQLYPVIHVRSSTTRLASYTYCALLIVPYSELYSSTELVLVVDVEMMIDVRLVWVVHTHVHSDVASVLCPVCVFQEWRHH